MATAAQQKATSAHRKRSVQRGLIRLEVQVPAQDAGLVREIAVHLRGEPRRAEALRSALLSDLAVGKAGSVLEMFASDLPEAYFEGVFDEQRSTRRPGADL